MSNEMVREFVDCYWQWSWNFELLMYDPTLLDTNTISNLEREAYNLLLKTQLDSEKMHDVLSTINAAALLNMCAGKPQPEVQELLNRFAFACKETIREHLKYALEICDRIIEQRFDQTIQPGGKIPTIREHYEKELENCNSSVRQIEKESKMIITYCRVCLTYKSAECRARQLDRMMLFLLVKLR